MRPLPKKLSSLLDLAVTDAQVVLRRKNFRENMGYWFTKLNDGTCTVCLAGSILARRGVECEPVAGGEICEAGPDQVAPSERKKLWAINAMRQGDFLYTAEHEMGLRLSEKQREACTAAADLVTDHYGEASSRAPWRVYREAAKILRRAGL